MMPLSIEIRPEYYSLYFLITFSVNALEIALPALTPHPSADAGPKSKHLGGRTGRDTVHFVLISYPFHIHFPI